MNLGLTTTYNCCPLAHCITAAHDSPIASISSFVDVDLSVIPSYSGMFRDVTVTDSSVLFRIIPGNQFFAIISAPEAS
jgi:hypothetical protein